MSDREILLAHVPFLILLVGLVLLGLFNAEAFGAIIIAIVGVVIALGGVAFIMWCLVSFSTLVDYYGKDR